MKSITTNVFTFEKLIHGNCVYVDKTTEIHKLLSVFSGQFFLSRPRRFGKSLLISTLKAIFQGKRELFKGLAIDALDYDWKSYPVIHLDMGSVQAATIEDFKVNLDDMLTRIEQDYGLASTVGKTHASRFIDLVSSLSKKSPEGQVVILVDEYDKPLLGHLGKEDVLAFRDLLKSFYSVIKTTEGLQRFAFITGVSKFSKVSIFSDLNNLIDLSLSVQAATLLGYTKAELLKYFPEYIQRLADREGATFDETVEKLTLWYDGYRFKEGAERVFNPVSVGMCLNNLEFNNYWYETATPTFLSDLLKRKPVDLQKLSAPVETFSVYEAEDPSPLALLVQTGYLTIKSSRMVGARRYYDFDYPNFEVSASFNDFLLTRFSEVGDECPSLTERLSIAFNEGDLAEVFNILPVFFASIPNTIVIQNEKYYQTIFFTLFSVLGTIIHAEVSTNIGRIDAVVENAQTIFVIEFKLRDTAEAALAQIREKKYYEKYLAAGKEVKLIGVAFDEETRNIGKWLVEVLK